MSKLWRAPAMIDVVEEHFDELDWMSEHREANLFTPDWTLAHLAYHEERMEAHLDGLRIANEVGLDLAREHLPADEPSAATAAALVLMAGGRTDDVDLVLREFAEGDEPVVDGIRIALRYHGTDGVVDRLREIAAGDSELAAVAACDVLAFQREASFAAARFLSSEEELVRRLGLGALGRTGQLTREQLATSLDDAEENVRRTALYEAARAGVDGLADLCRARALRATDPDPACVRFLGTLGAPEDVERIIATLERSEVAASAVAALGAAGRVEAVPLLLELFEDETLGPDAVRAYCRITGADDVEGHLPIPRRPVEEGEDEREALPPDPEKARRDWEQRRDAMDPSVAWQSGEAVPSGALSSGLDRLPLESRADVVMRVRASAGGSVPDVELEAFARKQVLRLTARPEGAPRPRPRH
ncbi:MAG: hypothetical protein AAGA20_15385 [Planctomycetota bacterium]